MLTPMFSLAPIVAARRPPFADAAGLARKDFGFAAAVLACPVLGQSASGR